MTRRFHALYGSPQPRTVVLGGTFTITGSGAILSQTGARIAGGTVTQVNGETGRYAVAFQRKFKRTMSAGAFFFGPDDSAFPTTTGSELKGRLLTTSGFAIQAVRTDTQADALPASGSVITWSALVSVL